MRPHGSRHCSAETRASRREPRPIRVPQRLRRPPRGVRDVSEPFHGKSAWIEIVRAGGDVGAELTPALRGGLQNRNARFDSSVPRSRWRAKSPMNTVIMRGPLHSSVRQGTARNVSENDIRDTRRDTRLGRVRAVIRR